LSTRKVNQNFVLKYKRYFNIFKYSLTQAKEKINIFKTPLLYQPPPHHGEGEDEK
jgi:hypothetical protein